MIVTRKIEIYVADDDAELRKANRKKMYEWRDLCRKAANTIIVHKMVQNGLTDFMYLTDEAQSKIYVKDIIKPGKGMSEQNTTYRICSDMMKGKVPASIFSCLNQAVCKSFKETYTDVKRGKATVRSYKNNIPVPFASKDIRNLHYDEELKRFEFSLFGIRMACRLGYDSSNNKGLLEKIIGGELQTASSSFMIDDDKKKTFMLLCYDQPLHEYHPTEGKELLARLDPMYPIVATINGKQTEIGNTEEFIHRRVHIQAAVRKCQINNRYSAGGKGRKKKCKALDRWHDKEKNYIEQKCHVYSRMLVDLATKNNCETIVLLDQKQMEDEAKQNEFILRNWSYYGLKTKIEYKSKLEGVRLEVRG